MSILSSIFFILLSFHIFDYICNFQKIFTPVRRFRTAAGPDNEYLVGPFLRRSFPIETVIGKYDDTAEFQLFRGQHFDYTFRVRTASACHLDTRVLMGKRRFYPGGQRTLAVPVTEPHLGMLNELAEETLPYRDVFLAHRTGYVLGEKYRALHLVSPARKHLPVATVYFRPGIVHFL